MHQMSDKIT